MNHRYLLRALVLASFLFTRPAYCQLVVTPNQTAAVLAGKLTGPGITISSPVLTCAGVANATFVSTATPILIDSGILLTSGRAINTAGAESFLASTNNGFPGDAMLTTLAGTATHDACVLEFDFVPKGDTVSFNYQFGSEEYINSTCGQYNDAFAFFISGPGITGIQNMALVPGTTIPVTVNSINSGVPGPPGFPGFCNIANCTSMGPGSPFTSYFYDNTGGTLVTYKGYTVKLTAQHDVMPCVSYHLKMAVADASNFLYDSGVFIEAGSLKTNTYVFSTVDSVGHTVNGQPHTIVKGCAPANVVIVSDHAVGTAQTLTFTYAGTAVNGVDYTAPPSITIPAGSITGSITVAALPTAVAGPKTVKIYLSSPFSCGIIDSVSLNILDSPSAVILTPDTTICAGQTFQIRTSTSAGLDFLWSPSAGLSSPFISQPFAAPATTTSYTLTANLPNAGCAFITRGINVTVTHIAVAILTNDTTICNGATAHLVATGAPGLTYNWSPAASLDSPATLHPIASPTTTTIYTLTATSALGCIATDNITVTIADPTAVIYNHDSTICAGASVSIVVGGNPTFVYSWSPATYLDNAGSMTPIATPSEPVTYTLTVTVPGTTCLVTKTLSIGLFAPIAASAGPDKIVCVDNSVPLTALPEGSQYSYLWSGPGGFTSTKASFTLNYAQAADQGNYNLLVTDNTTTCTAQDNALITVETNPVVLKNVTPNQTVAYGGTVQLYADNALYYRWEAPDGSLSEKNINNPVAKPLGTTTYVVYGINEIGCRDSALVTIDVTYDTVFLPTAFSPNGDGHNDFFHLVNTGYYHLVEMSVFSRWGNVVFHSASGESRGWDGTFNGAAVDMGVFNYLVIIATPDGTQSTIKGNVTVIR